MKKYEGAQKSIGNILPLWEKINLYYSVEIPIKKLGIIYQFKIWRMESMPMFIMVREDSGLLPWLRPGDSVNMKYYSIDFIHPYENLDTEIRDLRKQDRGKFRGHYLVDLEIMERKGFEDRYTWTYRSRNPQEISYNDLLMNI